MKHFEQYAFLCNKNLLYLFLEGIAALLAACLS
jgi:hypothetical protein